MGLSNIDKIHPRGNFQFGLFLWALSQILLAPTNLTHILNRMPDGTVTLAKQCWWVFPAAPFWLRALQRFVADKFTPAWMYERQVLAKLEVYIV